MILLAYELLLLVLDETIAGNKVLHLQWVGNIITGCWADARFRIFFGGERDNKNYSTDGFLYNTALVC